MKGRHRFHAICPYFAMFPESFVRRNVLAWSKTGDTVLDPFSGRGTTVFESLLHGRKALGCDLKPVAACISRAKADPPQKDEILGRLEQLEAESSGFSSAAREQDEEFFNLCFHKSTLRQILFLRDTLRSRESRTDCFITALALGCLHGESHRTPVCFSNRMPRTISTKPAYSVRWWQKHDCLPPRRDVFSILRAAAEYRYRSPLPAIQGHVVQGDVRHAGSLLSEYRNRVNLVITSPPYLDITDYHEDQWLRLWFLGGPPKPVQGQCKDDRHRVVNNYWQFLSEAWQGIAPLLHESAQLIVRIGGTRLDADALRAGLLTSLHTTTLSFQELGYEHTEIRNGQKRSFVTSASKPAIEHDFRFAVTNAG